MNHTLKRSNAPIFWALFGAGGMLAALLGPMMVLISGIATPLGLMPTHTLSYQNMLAFAKNGFGKGFVFLLITLFLWHAAHRIFHSLHDVGIHGGSVAKGMTYGLALLGTLITLTALLSLGF